ncbi:hypothetical protein F0562_000318 [Nyssa sinensis]|uniref:Amine oxidase n=1 Tax=Nyssa sinensis TaxID=561372 RepID=A0A5J5C196_9ASTE|nr:hypothetical protein F0562_000318 [Nyssa sinensis]
MPSTVKKLLIFFSLFYFSPISSSKHHPLDPLTASEFTLIQTIVKDSYPSSNLTFHYVGLDEPEKQTILSWLSNHTTKTPPRRAFVLTRLDKQTHEIIVDLTSSSLISDKIYTGNGYPPLTFEEQTAANEMPLTYPPFIESVNKRGLNVSDIVCSSYTVGWFGEQKSKRVLKILCYYAKGTANFYVRPLEGITLVVDLDDMKITEYYDRFIIPVPKGEGTEYRESKQKPPFGPRLNGAAIAKPDGPGFKIKGNTVRWANWNFHLGFDVRAGLIISLASIYDLEQQTFRRVLYRGYISELFVPYMDPTEDWYYKTFLDAGEFGFGLSAVSLKPMHDCPAHAVFMDAYYAAQDGQPTQISNVFCIFEQHAGNVMWRHTETGIPGEVITEVRAEVSLVVRMVSTVGNYDYMINWEFKPSGSIKVGVGLSGVLDVRGVSYTHTDEYKRGCPWNTGG